MRDYTEIKKKMIRLCNGSLPLDGRTVRGLMRAMGVSELVFAVVRESLLSIGAVTEQKAGASLIYTATDAGRNWAR